MTKFSFICLTILLAAFVTNAYGQTLTWDPDADQVNNGGAGTWDVGTTANWDDDATAPNTTWTNGNDAIFGSSGANYTVDIAAGGVEVGDLSLSAGAGTVSFLAAVDGEGVTVSAGGATWDLGGRRISFVNLNNANDTALHMTSGDTLTVTGAGTFDTGERPGGANWTAAGATLDFQGTTLRGNAGSVGQFGTVTMADGTTFIHERNATQGYGNNWELDGAVAYTNRFNSRAMNLNGEISGTGSVVVNNMGGQFVRLNNVANSFTGGIVVDSGGSRSELQVQNGDGALGAVPATFDADYITLRNGGELKFINGGTIDANRGITLDNGGIIINSGSPTTYGGTITGTGGLQVGRDQGADGNALILTSDTNDYTGGTRIVRGTAQLGIDNALSNTEVVTLGGPGATSQLSMDGFDQEIAGLELLAGTSNTRQIRNDGATASTLTINVGTGEEYAYAGNFVGSNTVNIVKTGAGTQIFNRGPAYTAQPGTIAVQDGEFVWGSTGGGDVNVGVNGILSGGGTFDGDVAVSGGLSAGVGTAGIDTLTFNNNLDLDATATTTLEFASGSSFDILNSGGTGIFTAGGTLNLSLAGYTAMENDVFNVFTNWNSFSGSFAQINGTSLGNGLAFDTSTLLTNGQLTVIAVPESSSALLLAVGLTVVGIQRRRRRKAQDTRSTEMQL